MLEIKLVKSTIAAKPNQKKTAEALGLKKTQQVVVKEDNEVVRGMIKTISHLVEVKEI